jgi:hypothetical protein
MTIFRTKKKKKKKKKPSIMEFQGKAEVSLHLVRNLVESWVPAKAGSDASWAEEKPATSSQLSKSVSLLYNKKKKDDGKDLKRKGGLHSKVLPKKQGEGSESASNGGRTSRGGGTNMNTMILIDRFKLSK